MKVAIIQNFFKPYVMGGAEIVVDNLTSELSKRGIEVILLTSYEKKKIEIEQVKSDFRIYRFFPLNFYFNFPLKQERNKLVKLLWWVVNLWNPYVFFVVRKILMEEKPDIVHVNNFYSLSSAVFSAAKSLGIPTLYTAHDFYPLCKNSSFTKNGNICRKRCFSCVLWGFWNKIFMRSVKFKFLSCFSKELYKRYFKVSGVVLPTPVFLSKLEIKMNIQFREKMQRDLDKIIFLFLGRLSINKGIMTLLKAFEKVEYRNAALLVGGDGELRDCVKEYVKRDSRIKYLGFVSGEKKKEALLNSDVFILPSEWYEVSPLTIQEAYGYGLPVVGTNLGSIPEHIEVGKTGYIFGYKNVDELRDIMKNLCMDKQKLKIASKNCFEKALGNLSSFYIERAIENYNSVIRNVY